jgi:ABC-type molybdate transport system ATPase subunit
VYVTHDEQEIAQLADRLLVLGDGRVKETRVLRSGNQPIKPAEAPTHRSPLL